MKDKKTYLMVILSKLWGKNISSPFYWIQVIMETTNKIKTGTMVMAKPCTTNPRRIGTNNMELWSSPHPYFVLGVCIGWIQGHLQCHYQ